MNKMLRLSGSRWEEESFDHLIRSLEHFEAFVRYVENNPVAAGLCQSPEDWLTQRLPWCRRPACKPWCGRPACCDPVKVATSACRRAACCKQSSRPDASRQEQAARDGCTATAMNYRKKLIEVALPLEAINKASAREKSIRHGHPSTLHLWWARRPLAACRAVLFASLVDDPDSDPMFAGDENLAAIEAGRTFQPHRRTGPVGELE